MEAEEVIRRALGCVIPNAALLGEESGGELRRSGMQWVIDPLDGTAAYAIGSPNYGILIGLLFDGDPVVGVIHFPATGETVSAARGAGCWYERPGGRPTPLNVRSTRTVSEAYASASGLHGSELVPDGGPTFTLLPLVRESRRFRVVGDCLQHALVARGTIDVAVDTRMAPWDTVAVVACIREAGGVVATADGGDDVILGGSLVSAATPELLDEVVALLAGGAREPRWRS